MKVSMVTAPSEIQVVDVPRPTVGPKDALIKIRPCGACGSDAYIAIDDHVVNNRCQPRPSDNVVVTFN
jgi:D-arabinose 1-dehydrogenase-like Zn-dependent alcohol dehydrogenase